MKVMQQFEKYFSSKSVQEKPFTLTILDCKEIEIQSEGEAAQKKTALFFEEDPRGLVLNKGRAEKLVELFGSDESDEWIGRKIKIVYDKNVKFKGKPIGGIAIQPAN